MTPTHFPLHTVMPEDLPHALQPLQVLVVNTEQSDALQGALQHLYAHQAISVGYLACAEAALGAIIELCVEAGVVPVVVGIPYFYAPKEPFAASLIAPSTNIDENGLCRQLYEHPQLDLFSVIGHQLYLSAPGSIAALHQRYYETVRLGALRDNMNTAEPMLRESHQVYFDLCAVRSSDAPECTQHRPNGMYAEEICQIAHYAGTSDHIYYANISGYHHHLTASSQTMQLVAQTIWHIIDGIASRRVEEIVRYEENPCLKKIIVNMDNHQQLFFLKSETSHRWWMNIPLKEGSYRWMSCLYEDYLQACKQEVPARWLWFYQKFKLK